MFFNKASITIVIPTYNERGNIVPLCQQIFKYLSDANVLIIDDNSTDGTKNIIEELSKKYAKLNFLIRNNKKRSFSQSYIDGFRIAIKNNVDYIIQMDADFSHNPKYLPEITKYLNDNGLVIGSRYISGGKTIELSIFREFLSRFGNYFARFATKIPVKDLTAGFAGWRSSELKKINFDKIKTDGYTFQIELKMLAFKNKLKVKEIPITFINRTNGGSKMNKKIIFEAIVFCLKSALNITN